MIKIYDYIFKNKKNNKKAIIDCNNNDISYNQLYNSCVKTYNELLNVNSTKNIILYTGNSIEFAIGLLAIWMSNRTAILIDIKWETKEINDMIETMDCNTVIYSSITGCKDLLCKNFILPTKTNKVYNNWSENIKDNDLALYIPTSGTTQNAKFVMLTHKGIVEECEGIKESHGYCENTREMLIVPITSSFGCIGQLLVILYSGGSISLYQGCLNVQKLRRSIFETKPNVIACTPSIMSLFIHPFNGIEKDFKSVKKVILAGEASSFELIKEIKKTLRINNVTQAYGLTETSSQISGNSINANTPYGSVGIVNKNFILRIKEGDIEKKINEIGEIQVKGNAVTCGYFNNENLNDQSFDGKWFKTGDIGFIDEIGYLYIVGRIKNIIIVAGKNVYAEEVEKILMDYSLIKYAFVFSEKSNYTGEKIIANINVKCNDFDINKLHEYCRKTMKSYMIPKEFRLVDKYDLNSTGKASRKK